MKGILAETSNPEFKYLVGEKGEIELVGGMILFLSAEHFIRTSRVEKISYKNCNGTICDMVVTTRNSVYIFSVEEMEEFIQLDDEKRDIEIILEEYAKISLLAEKMIEAEEESMDTEISRKLLDKSNEVVKNIRV